MKHQAVILRVNRHAAGARFPFDKVYFFKREAQEHLPRIFRCALVIMPTKPFVGMVSEATEAFTCHAGKVYPLKRRDGEKMTQMMKDELPIRDVIANYKNYVGLIPILYLQNEDKPKEIAPEYLHATKKPRPSRGRARRKKGQKSDAPARSVANMRRMFQDTFTSRSYFLIDGQKFSPVCTVCPNSLLMVTGECHLGDQECYEKLSQVKPSNFRKNMAQYIDWVKRVGEPELQLEDENE